MFTIKVQINNSVKLMNEGSWGLNPKPFRASDCSDIKSSQVILSLNAEGH